MTSISDQILAHASPEFWAAYQRNLALVRGAEWRVYSTKIYYPNLREYRYYDTLAWYHGVCPDKGQRTQKSHVTIVQKGRVKSMTYCANSRLTPLEEWLRERNNGHRTE
jgi:hypothetical protein